MKRVLILAGSAVALSLRAASSQASTPARIVFAADRAPTVTGEIYRLDPNGRRVDLSKSPSQDLDPAVSPDGKHVAFFSDRAGKWAVYEVGIDGRGLRRFGPATDDVQAGGGELLWQPDGQLVAVVTGGQSWIEAAGRKPVLVRKSGFYPGSWSPDGRVLVLSSQNEVEAVAPSGRELWHVPGQGVSHTSAWSSHGLLAIAVGHRAAIYDESGHLHLTFSLPTTFPSFSWSPDGGRLAIGWNGPKHQQVEVRTSGGGLVLQKVVFGLDLGWANNFKVVAGIPDCLACKTVGIDIRTGKVSPTSSRWLDPLSPDGKLAIVTPPVGPTRSFTLGVGRAGGSALQKYSRLEGCFSDGDWLPAATALQFVGGTRSIVYQSWNVCDPPFANLYSVAPAGGKAQRLTDIQAQETQPALSPDGSEIAYVWAARTGLSCSGCSDGIRIVGANGTGSRTLTDPGDCTFDDSPTWSPDGSTILYTESTCSSGGELFTIPASGGTPHDLGIGGDNPAWGPTRIAFDGTHGLTTANPDGSDPQVVSRDGDHPTWSPDGTLAYRLGKSVVVGGHTITLPFAQVTSVRWSPDGTRLVVTASKTKLGPLDLYTVKTDGTDPIRLTKNYGAISWIS